MIRGATFKKSPIRATIYAGLAHFVSDWKLRWAKLRRRTGPEGSPDDPYAYVGAPKKPKLPGRSASAAAPLD